MDKVLKNHIRVTHGVGQRTLQEWLRAGVVPGVRRTRQGRGHYRVPAPPGMTVELYESGVRLFGESARVTGDAAIRRLGWERVWGNTPHLVAASGLPDTWWQWQRTVADNVKKYRHAVRQLQRVFRGGPVRLPHFTLRQYEVAVRQRRGRTTSSAKVSSSQVSSSQEPF